jgi:hypothetical protein
MEDIACTVKVRENKLKRKGARQWHCGCNSIITVLRQDQIIFYFLNSESTKMFLNTK